MKIAVDIDGTLCWSNLPVFLDECNKTFELGIEQVVLDSLENKKEFYALSEVTARLEEDEYFLWRLDWIEFRKRCLLESLVMDDAVTGVARLATLGDVAYYTARYCEEREIHLEMKKYSKQWLKHHNFVNPQKVVLCNAIEGKINKILKIAKNDDIFLIDDSYKLLLDVINHLKKRDRLLLVDRLTLVAMRAKADELPSSDIKMIALPYWDEIETIVERIQSHARQKQTTQTADYSATA